MKGKTVLVTGANSGIGLETAAGLAQTGAEVVITSRDPAKGAAAVEEIKRRHADANVTAMQLDLARLDDVRRFVREFDGRFPCVAAVRQCKPQRAIAYAEWLGTRDVRIEHGRGPLEEPSLIARIHAGQDRCTKCDALVGADPPVRPGHTIFECGRVPSEASAYVSSERGAPRATGARTNPSPRLGGSDHVS